MRLRRGPHREGPLDLGYGRIRPVSKQLTDVREGDGVRRTSPTRVEAVPLCAEGAECLLLEVLANGLQIDKGSDSKRPEEVGIANTRELKKCGSLTRTSKCEMGRLERNSSLT